MKVFHYMLWKIFLISLSESYEVSYDTDILFIMMNLVPSDGKEDNDVPGPCLGWNENDWTTNCQYITESNYYKPMMDLRSYSPLQCNVGPIGQEGNILQLIYSMKRIPAVN